jgi:hypothetical protein
MQLPGAGCGLMTDDIETLKGFYFLLNETSDWLSQRSSHRNHSFLYHHFLPVAPRLAASKLPLTHGWSAVKPLLSIFPQNIRIGISLPV